MGNRTSMTVDDLVARESIRDVMARYNIAGDRLKVEDFAACFTADGILESDYVSAADAFCYVGREAIREWQQRWRNGDGTKHVSTHAATFIRHHLTTSQIDLTGPDTANARTYWTAWTDIGPDHAGYYLDAFRKEDGVWLIAHRRVRMDWKHDNSLFKTAIANSKPDGGQMAERPKA